MRRALLPLIGALGATPAPSCFEVRLQAGFVDGPNARFGVRCDPLRGH